MVPQYSLQSDLQLARELADMADSISSKRFRANDLLVTMKPDMTYVTDADKAVESAIRGGLADSRPHDAILGEEFFHHFRSVVVGNVYYRRGSTPVPRAYPQ